MKPLSIIECKFGYYGKNCLNECSENCIVPKRCDMVTGQCDGEGCKPGWKPTTCDQSRCLGILYSQLLFVIK